MNSSSGESVSFIPASRNHLLPLACVSLPLSIFKASSQRLQISSSLSLCSIFTLSLPSLGCSREAQGQPDSWSSACDLVFHLLENLQDLLFMILQPTINALVQDFFINHEYLVGPSYKKSHTFQFWEILLNYFLDTHSTFSLFCHSKTPVFEVRVLKFTFQFSIILSIHTFWETSSTLSPSSFFVCVFHFCCYIPTLQKFCLVLLCCFIWFVVVAFGKAILFLFYGYNICFYVSENIDCSYVCCFVYFVLFVIFALFSALFLYSQIYFYSLWLIFVTVFHVWGFSQMYSDPWLKGIFRIEAPRS